MPKYSYFWSSTEKDSANSWVVNFKVGRDHWGSKSIKFCALCVR